MHEELYVAENSKIRYVMLIIGIVLLPFSVLSFVIEDGVPLFLFRLNTPLLAAALLFGTAFFENEFKSKLMRFFFPYIALLTLEFLRFGTVRIFERQLPYDVFIVSAFFMLAAVGFSFILFFIAQGKMRTKVFLFLWSALMAILATVSLICGILPFAARAQITSGVCTVSVSDYIALLILCAAGICIAVALKSDRVAAEVKARRENKKS